MYAFILRDNYSMRWLFFTASLSFQLPYIIMTSQDTGAAVANITAQEVKNARHVTAEGWATGAVDGE